MSRYDNHQSPTRTSSQHVGFRTQPPTEGPGYPVDPPPRYGAAMNLSIPPQRLDQDFNGSFGASPMSNRDSAMSNGDSVMSNRNSVTWNGDSVTPNRDSVVTNGDSVILTAPRPCSEYTLRAMSPMSSGMFSRKSVRSDASSMSRRSCSSRHKNAVDSMHLSESTYNECCSEKGCVNCVGCLFCVLCATFFGLLKVF